MYYQMWEGQCFKIEAIQQKQTNIKHIVTQDKSVRTWA